jgi:hypothetical protein
LPAAQAVPAGFFVAQVLLERSQYDPVAQFASAVQADGRQVVALMQATPPVHAAVVAVPGLQLPAPSQVAGVVVSWPPEQDDVPVQAVPAAASAQAPWPLQ